MSLEKCFRTVRLSRHTLSAELPAKSRVELLKE